MARTKSSPHMLRNYLYVAIRTMRRNMVYTLVNIVGLSIGLASAILITTFIRYELSYESFLPGVDQLYRVTQWQADNYFLGSNEFTVTQAGLATTIEEEIPEVQHATSFDNSFALLGTGDQFYVEEGLFADDQFFNVFGHTMLVGDAPSVLVSPESIVLSESLASRLFATADPRGEVLEIVNRGSFIVTGIFEDVPGNSHLQFGFVASILGDDRYQENLGQWSNSSWLTYIRFFDGTSESLAAEHIQALVAKYDISHEPGEKEFRLQPVKSIHLRSHINFELSPNGDIRFVYLLLGIGIVILVLACVNYVNLAVTRSVQRAKEVGVRKVVGALRSQIAGQFLSESILTATIAVGLALVFVIVSFPTFARFISQDLSVLAGDALSFSLMLVAFILIVGILGGLYPSIVASRMRPAIILKGSGRHGVSSGQLRKVLVTLQFCVSVSLLAASVIMFRQMQFIQDTDIGYARDHIVTIQLADRTLRNQISAIRTALKKNSGVISVAGSGHLPTNIQSSTGISKWTDGGADDGVKVYQNSIDYDFLELYDIPVVMGRGFSEDHPSDTLGAYVINETAFKRFGWDDLEGKYIHRSGRDREVVGVIRDFHMHSLHMEIEPLMFYLRPENESRISAKLAGKNLRETLAFVESEMQRLSAYPITVKFVDESFAELYESDLQLGRTVGLFMGLALLIGALGLFGLVAYSAETRTKEIGIRKVMGSTIPGVLILFARDYARLILIASCIGLPLAYFVMNSWLERFAYRITLSPIDFILAAILLTVVAAVSISYQTIRAALADPVHALRYE